MANRVYFYARLIASLGSCASTVWASVTPWKQLDDSNGIAVYERGVPDEAVLEFRGVGDIDAPVEKVLSIIVDESRAKEWAGNLEETRAIERTSPFEWIEYNHFGTPFIVKDRDLVNKVKIEVDRPGKTAKIIQFSIETPLMPETRFVRAHLKRAEFRLTPKGSGTHFDGEILVDPKGSLPKWIFNLFQRSWPRATLESLRRQAAKSDIVVNPAYLNLFGQK